MNIVEFRKKYPQYDDLNGIELAKGMHAKYYSDMPYEDFADQIGLAVLPEPSEEIRRAAREAVYPTAQISDLFTTEGLPEIAGPVLTDTQIKDTETTLNKSFADIKGNVVNPKTSQPFTRPEYEQLKWNVNLAPDRFSAREKSKLRTIENAVYPMRDIGRRITWLRDYVTSFGGAVGRYIGAPNLRQELLQQAKEFPGWSGALAEPSGDAGTFYIKYVLLLPAIMRGLTGLSEAAKRLPKVKAAAATVEKLGGTEWLLKTHPRKMQAVGSAIESFTKGAAAIAPVSGLEYYGRGMSLEEATPYIIRDAIFYGSVVTAFDLASSYDRYAYGKQLRAELKAITDRTHAQKFGVLQNELRAIQRAKPLVGPRGDVVPRTPRETQIGKEIKGLASLKRTAYKTIDDIVSSVEAELAGMTKGEPYKQSELVRESAIKMAQQFAAGGGRAGVVQPRGAEPFRTEMGRREPSIKMPTTRLGEMLETIRGEARITKPTKPVSAAELKLKPRAKVPTAEVPAPPEAPGVVAPPARRPVEILPRKTDLLTEIKTAIDKAPSEKELRSRLDKEIKVPDLPPKATEAQEKKYWDAVGEKSSRISKEVEKLKSKTVKFEIDGGANIINTKEALQDFHSRIKKAPEREWWPKAPTRPTKKKPLAGKREKIDLLLKAPAGYFTDGRLLVKGKAPVKAKKEMEGRYGAETKGLSKKTLDELLNAETKPAEFQHYAWSSPEVGKGTSGIPIGATKEDMPIAVFKSEGKYYTYDQDRFNVITNKYPETSPNWMTSPNITYGVAENGMLVAYDKGKPVATLMPLGEPGVEKPPVDMAKTLEQDEIEAFQKGYNEALIQAKKSAKEPVPGPYPEPEDEVARYGKALGKTRDQVTADLEATGLDPDVIKMAVDNVYGEPEVKKPAKPAVAPEEKPEEVVNKEGLTITVGEKYRFSTTMPPIDRVVEVKSVEKTKWGWKATLVDQNGKVIGKGNSLGAFQDGTINRLMPLEAPAAKEPWEMTKAEAQQNLKARYVDSSTFNIYDKTGKFIEQQTYTKGAKDAIENVHYYGIQKALDKGKPIPRHVLEEYKGEKWAQEALAKPTEEPSVFIPEAEPETLSKIVIDQFREWPKAIKPVGKDFWTEVLAAARKLLTSYRYKALRSSLLGVHRVKGRKPGIELQNVQDVLTAVHELGHNIDWKLNAGKYPSSIKLRFPKAADYTERELRTELENISRVLRPDLWRAADAGVTKGYGTRRYLAKHTELMADFISHYILDPETTKSIAPKMTKVFADRLEDFKDIRETIEKLHATRYEGPKEPAIAKAIKEQLRMPSELHPLLLIAEDIASENYVKQAEQLGIIAARHYRVLIGRARAQADRIDKLVPSRTRQTDLVVIVENAPKNPWTGKTKEQILKDNPLTGKERKALKLYRAYQELARQTINKYLRGADISEYIKFLEDYFIHAYETPMTQKYRTAITKWAKRSPQARKRVIPNLAEAVELDLDPRARTLSEGLRLWAGINYRVATNIAFLKALPKITNEDGESILQKPKDFPDWPTVDYWPIRKAYAIPLPGRGILLFQGRVAVDPKVKPFIDAMFGYMFSSRPAYWFSGLNAILKAFQITVFSAFHHVAEFFSTVGGVGKKIFGLWGKSRKPFEDTLKSKILLRMPILGPFYAGSQLKQTVDFMDDYLSHGGRTGYITGEGIGLLDRMLKDLEHYLANMMVSVKPLAKAVWLPYLPVKAVATAHHAWQQFLWGTIVENGKLLTYYVNAQDLMKAADKGARKGKDMPTADRIKEMCAQYVNNNYGGQEWLNTMFQKPQFRWRMFQIFRSWDWTYGQLKTPLYLTGRGLGARSKAERQLFRRIGRRHWLWYILAVWGATQGLQYALNRKFTWENEPGHRLDVDYTKRWRWKDEIISKWLGRPNWKERGDMSRRYTVFGKAGREFLYWFREPLVEFGRKLSPIGESVFEQLTGYNVGSEYPAPWVREDLETYEKLAAKAKAIAEMVVPFSFRGNNAFLALPLRKGMTRWKATRAYRDIYTAKAKIAYESKFKIALLKAGRIHKNPVLLFANEDRLRKDIAEACKINNVDSEKADRIALSRVKSMYYGKFSRAANLRKIEECNKYARALIELGATPRSLIQSIKSRGLQLTEKGREIEIEAFQKAAQEYFKEK